jgi:hypothetical protein
VGFEVWNGCCFWLRQCKQKFSLGNVKSQIRLRYCSDSCFSDIEAGEVEDRRGGNKRVRIGIYDYKRALFVSVATYLADAIDV